MKIPPALAVVEGIAGAIKTSAKDRPYASPSVLFPKNLTNSWATLSPKPVFSKPYIALVLALVIPRLRKLCKSISVYLESHAERQHYLGKEERHHNQPNHVVCEGSKRPRESQSFCCNCNGSCKKSPRAYRKGFKNQACYG